MINENNFIDVLNAMDFSASDGVYEKIFANGVVMKADVVNRKLIYPAQVKGRDRNDFYDESHNENLVVFECVNRLLDKGYNPADIELEKVWTLGHEQKSGRADIVVSQNDKTLFIIECKTAGREFDRELRNMKSDGGQLFSYWQQENSCKWLVLYAADFADNKITHAIKTVNCSDDKNLVKLAIKDPDTKLYQNAHTVEERYEVWSDTYSKNFEGDVIFSVDTLAYDIGIKPKRKGDLVDFARMNKVVNEFEEILRHNNVSDKENAFNRLVALFICKLVDESEKTDNDKVEFSYHDAVDTYESLQDRLQRLHRDGMSKFMNEDIFYLEGDYIKNLVEQYRGGNRHSLIDELESSFRKLKFYTNSDFAFKEVHNEELFYQNGKVLAEVVKLFQNYKIIGSEDLQTLGDLFEQLLNKGFKQNEGQFFTPIPITRFIWDSLPIDNIIKVNGKIEVPKIIDYACGAGHFLTEGFAAIKDCFARNDFKAAEGWELGKIFGVEKDYRLARVSKISLFMHGINNGKIKFGDGLENYPDEGISAGSFDILVANPPYAIKSFKQHLKLKNKFITRENVSEGGSEIETLFVERIAQLVKPNGVAAVILPSSILNKDGKSFVAARESMLQNFNIRAIAQFGSKTFSATGTNTVIVFLQKLPNNPSRFKLIIDSIDNIFNDTIADDWEDKTIFDEYIKKINVAADTYRKFVRREIDYTDWRNNSHFGVYVAAFENKFVQRDNYRFYEFAIAIERDKIHYFAMTYNQTTLVISAPADNNEQENFLGYSWSNAKGDEGIKIKSAGGLLYDNDNRTANNKLAAAVRSAFASEQVQIPDADKYYNYLRLSDMLDFSGADFIKTISMLKNFELNYSGKFPVRRWEEVLKIQTGKDYKAVKNSQGKYPVYGSGGLISRADEFICPENTVVIGRKGTINKPIFVREKFWNIDTAFGIIANEKFILPEYLFYFCLQFNFEILNRQLTLPSLTRKDLYKISMPVPPLDIQRQIVSEFKAIDDEMLALESAIAQLDIDVKDKFAEMFNDVTETVKLSNVAEIIQGTSPKSNFYNETGEGLPFYQGKKDFGDFRLNPSKIWTTSIIKTSIKNDILMSVRAPVGDVNINPFEKICIGRGLAAIRCNDLTMQHYLFYWLYFNSDNINGHSGTTFASISGDEIKSIMIPIPPIELQKEFASFAQKCDNQKQSARVRRQELLAERKQLVDKYFR